MLVRNRVETNVSHRLDSGCGGDLAAQLFAEMISARAYQVGRSDIKIRSQLVLERASYHALLALDKRAGRQNKTETDHERAHSCRSAQRRLQHGIDRQNAFRKKR